ncbi:hypothetical protein BGZ80_004545 [Entomortierella chlamydospora]|uniref:Integral membrane protein n=1 Tax=Entomortierella chlamydospora TaxID=101097 RepID=A0A9P6MMI7_9FUNG|nr:hypothetical protein BGZ80_004545 [Entomortierella chlamydospora]
MQRESASQAAELSDVKVVSRQSSVRSIKQKRMSILDSVIVCSILCVIGGVSTASQGAINSNLGKYTGQGLSSTIVFCVGAITSCIYFLIEVKGRPPANLALMITKAPWWSWTGGILGACFVIVTILSIPKLGAGTTTAIIISAKLVFSCIIDQFGLFGIPHRKYTIWRALATVGLVGEDVILNPNLLVIVQGLGEVPPGQWARKLFTNGKRGQWGLATQFPFIERALHLGWAVVLCDPNHDENKPRNQKTRARHVRRVWEDIVQRSDARCVMYVCFSAGTTAVLDLYRTSKREFVKKVKGIAFLDGEDGRDMGRWMQNHSWSFCQDKPKWKPARNETFIPRLDLAIKDISFIVKPKESVGIVGRRGAGRSSLTLFRIIEAADGYWVRASNPTYAQDRPLDDPMALYSDTHGNALNGGLIEIDSVDIPTLGLKGLR